jgi:hypothetical protein
LRGIDLGEKIFLIQDILSCFCSKFREVVIYAPAIQIRVKIASLERNYCSVFFFWGGVIFGEAKTRIIVMIELLYYWSEQIQVILGNGKLVLGHGAWLILF